MDDQRNLKEAKHDAIFGGITVPQMRIPVNAQQPATPSPADYVLVTVVLRHDQSRNLEEITKLMEDTGFWAKFPPEGITVESWYVAMGLGHVVTLRVPPARSREVSRSIEQNTWKAYRTEIYLTYDFGEIARRKGSCQMSSLRLTL